MRRMRFCFGAMVLLITMIWITTPCSGQTSQITGVVKDPNNLGIGGAEVKVLNTGTNISKTTITNDTGEYTIPGLNTGTYSVIVTKKGFEKLERRGITLFVATVTRVDLILSIGHTTETVTVTGEASLLQPENAQLSTEISRKQYDELPLVQQGRIRSPTAFVYLAPSVQGNLNATGSENLAATNYISVNGSQVKTTEFYLSGLSSGQMANVGSYNESAPPVDAVQEFKMITTALPADYGHTGSAAGVFAIRNGTNELHGSAYEYFRNNILDATAWGTINKTYTRQNEFGVTLGGPIVLPKIYRGKNRSFFFFSYGGSRKAGMDTLKTSQIPTPAQISGDFTGFRTLYDPATTRLNSTGTGYIRDAFQNNKIPANRINPLAAQIAAYFPKPNTTGTNNYKAWIGETKLNPDVYTARVDHQFSETQHLYFTLIQIRIPRYKPEGSGLPQPLATVYQQFLRPTTTRINHDWTISPHIMNSLALGYYRIFQNRPIAGTEFQIPNQVSAVRPSITFSNGYASVSTDNGAKTAEHQYLGSDVLYLTKGSHNMRIGGEYRRVHFNAVDPNPGTNSAAFNYLETADPTNNNSTGDGFASFLLGTVHSGAQTKPGVSAIRYSYAGLFFQDDWKISHRVTMNVGIRWEFEGIPVDADDRASTISLTYPNTAAGNLPGALIFAGSGPNRTGTRTLAPQRYTGFSPRFGISYQPIDKVVLRGGLGIFYMDLGWNMSSLDQNGFIASASYASKDNGITPAFSLSTGYPGASSLTPTISHTLLNGQAGNFFDSTIGYFPWTAQWNFSVEYSPTQKWLFEAAYVGNNNHRLSNAHFSNINQVNPSYLSLGSILSVSASSTAAANAGISLPYSGFNGTVAQALRAYPQYLGLTNIMAKVGYTNYHAGQLIVQRRMGNGLRISANYTFAKNMGINSPAWMDSTTDNVLQNAWDPGAEYSISPLDVHHALVLNYSYELPFGTNKKYLSHGKLANYLAGGWRFSAIQRYQSGFPLPIKTSNSLPIFNRILRPNVVAGAKHGTNISANDFKPGLSRIINKDAFTAPAAYTFGNAKPTYSDMRCMPVYTEDVSVSKSISITKQLKWEFGANFFNTFNRHRFTSFDTTYSDAGFGQSTAVSAPRFIQLSARLQF